MGKKLNLPLFSDLERDNKPTKTEGSSAGAKRPSIDAARQRLGGRIVGDEPPPPPGLAPGVLVKFALAADRIVMGAIVFASQTEVHVLLDSIRLRRLPPEELTIHEGDIDGDLGKIAADARLFGGLVESESIRYADDAGTLIAGKIVEKCRWGALVLRDDGAVVAVGFRKLWPNPPSGTA